MARLRFDIVKFFEALSDRNRLRLINIMGDEEVCVCYFVEILKMPQPRVSRHLAYLRNAGMVEARRDGKWIHYKMVEPPDDHAATILKNLREHLTEDKEMRQDRERLMKICCALSLPVRLQGAPRPVIQEV